MIHQLATRIGWREHHYTSQVLELVLRQIKADQDAAHRMGYEVNALGMKF